MPGLGMNTKPYDIQIPLSLLWPPNAILDGSVEFAISRAPGGSAAAERLPGRAAYPFRFSFRMLSEWAGNT